MIETVEAERLKGEALRLYRESREHKRRAEREREAAKNKRTRVSEVIAELAQYGIEVELVDDIPGHHRQHIPSTAEPKGGHSGYSNTEQSSQVA